MCRSNLHDACSLGGDDGGSVDCVKAVLKFYDDDEKEQDQLWQKKDSRLREPLFCAATRALHRILEWRLQGMSAIEKDNFFSCNNKDGKGPIDSLINKAESDMTRRYDHDTRKYVFESELSIEDELKALNVMVSHLTTNHEKQVRIHRCDRLLSHSLPQNGDTV